jgi:type IV pilus assembly protein PilV
MSQRRIPHRPSVPTIQRSSGLSLIEVLIALVVVSVGLLGMVGLQAYALKNNNSAYYRSQANNLAYEILDEMRANRIGALGAAYKLDLGGTAPGTATRAARDVSHWLNSLPYHLPNGSGAIACYINRDSKTPCNTADPVCVCVVTIQWDDSRGAGGGDLQQLTLSTRI